MPDWVNDNVAQPNAAIELHDSDLIALSHELAGLILDLRAYVHRSHGIPGTDPGTGWLQPASIILANGRLSGPKPVLPCTIADGEIEAGGQSFRNLIPCPFASEDEAAIDLILASGQTLHIDADQITIVFNGEAEFIEACDGQ